jgi:RNA polymerase sigma-54 factor
MFQYQVQTIKPLTTAHLAQTMTLLQMTSEELSQKIETELAKNPALEMVEERRCPTCKRILVDPGPCPLCSRPKNLSSEDPIVFISSYNEYNPPSRNPKSDFYHEDFPDDNIAPETDLPTHILQQISSDLVIEDRPIAAHILTSLDDDGLLRIPKIEISRYHHVPVSRIDNILRLIQNAEPIGVGSSSPEEALLVQLKTLKEYGKDVPELAEQAIGDGLSYLSRHQYDELAKCLKINPTEAKKIAQFISSNLNPYPGRTHWGDVRQKNQKSPHVYHSPDIIIKKLNSKSDSPLIVEILLPLRGSLQINSLFRQMTKNISEESKDIWKKDLENANLLIKCIQQRNNTMQRLMSYLAVFQREFILQGDHYLRPTTRAEISRTLDVHESTISRAVSGKCMQLPSGRIIPISMLFDRSLPIRAHLKDLIKTELHPYTDSQLVILLAEEGYKIARRTVAKYRSMEGILPAHLRKHN